MAHYFASIFFAGVIVSAFEIDDNLYISGVSDHLYSLDVTLHIDIWSWHGELPIESVTHNGEIVSFIIVIVLRLVTVHFFLLCVYSINYIYIST